MRYLLTTFTAIMAFGMLTISAPVLAQTPDGQTPAGEAVCDPLMANGVTKGLYGLCVAFCEAQDYADESDPISEEELATLERSAPSGRILANYNKKKDKANNPADPDMPCILVQEPCPCWSGDEIAAIDGIMYDGYDTPRLTCRDLAWSSYIYEERSPGADFIIAQIFNVDGTAQRDGCFYTVRNSPGNTLRNLSVQAGTLTQDEYDACVVDLDNHKAQYIGTKDCTD